MMPFRLPSLLLAVLAGPGLAAAGIPAAPPPRAPLAERIDALLGPHLRPPGLPVTLPNPFLLVRGSIELTDGRDVGVPTPAAPPEDDGPLDDAEFLARSISRLKIGGTMQANDTTQLTINGELYKEGDHLLVETKPAPLHVQIVSVSPTEFTLRYRSATQTVRLKIPPKPREPDS